MAYNPHKPRFEQAYDLRVSAAALARARPHPTHHTSRDEVLYRNPSTNRPTYLANFTKGLPKDPHTGLIIDPADYVTFVRAIDRPTEENLRRVKLGPAKGEFYSGIANHPPAGVRAWESSGAGATFDLQGPDAQAVTMPPYPSLQSVELVAEMTELYWMALLRDVSLSFFSRCGREMLERTGKRGRTHKYRPHWGKVTDLVDEAIAGLSRLPWACEALHGLSEAEKRRRRGGFDVQSVFRGNAPGDLSGPYLSQFLIVGTKGLGDVHSVRDGYIQYGSTRIDQRVRVATPGRDYMTTWASWLDVQQGADVRGRETYEDDPTFRFISTGRDLATYVHYDALYQAYLNACLILLDIKAPFDEGVPFQSEDRLDKQQGFATFGGPHILTLVTEVATRALKAVRFQKYNVHRRLRPEAVGGLLDRIHGDRKNPIWAGVRPLYEGLDKKLIQKVAEENDVQSKFTDGGRKRSDDWGVDRKRGSLLLPMAFPEGSPMHPSYGAGHATVSGACVTVLKAFFDAGYVLPFRYVVREDGSGLEEVPVRLTVEGELNKLATNISNGRNWGGVHYWSDTYESIRLGEKVALGMLEEQKLTYGENFYMTVPLFDGTTVRI